jgi:DNA-binding transcriptional ArsR family regulator
VTQELVRIGSLIADATRAEILTALMDGRARTGSELARHVGVAPSTASEHLSKLLDASMVTVEAQGRHRYWRLAGPAVATLLEMLGANAAAVGPPAPPAPRGLRVARSCYDHLAGELAVVVFDRLVGDGVLLDVDHHLTVTPSGIERFATWGVDVAALQQVRSRPLARTCLDWTERRHHLGGSLGRAMFEAFQSNGWVRRGRGPRTVDVTDLGRGALRTAFGWAP